MSILTVTIPRDTHAIAVQAVLQDQGVSCDALIPQIFPQHMLASFSVGPVRPPETKLRVGQAMEELATNSTVVWNPRCPRKIVPFLDTVRMCCRALASHQPLTTRLFVALQCGRH